jgi:quinol-cytochrome oxidoreductase complex cytochrome b subunit
LTKNHHVTHEEEDKKEDKPRDKMESRSVQNHPFYAVTLYFIVAQILKIFSQVANSPRATWFFFSEDQNLSLPSRQVRKV